MMPVTVRRAEPTATFIPVYLHLDLDRGGGRNIKDDAVETFTKRVCLSVHPSMTKINNNLLLLILIAEFCVIFIYL